MAPFDERADAVQRSKTLTCHLPLRIHALLGPFREVAVSEELAKSVRKASSHGRESLVWEGRFTTSHMRHPGAPDVVSPYVYIIVALPPLEWSSQELRQNVQRWVWPSQVFEKCNR